MCNDGECFRVVYEPLLCDLAVGLDYLHLAQKSHSRLGHGHVVFPVMSPLSGRTSAFQLSSLAEFGVPEGSQAAAASLLFGLAE